MVTIAPIAAIRTAPAIVMQISAKSFAGADVSKNDIWQFAHDAAVKSTILLHWGHTFFMDCFLRSERYSGLIYFE